jgi:hypothetical protein
MNLIINLIKSLFIQESIDTITKSLAKTVVKLEAHTDKTALKVDKMHEQIDDKIAFHRAELNELTMKAVDLRNEAQQAAAIARNIGALLK